VNSATGLAGRNVFQRNIFILVFNVDENGVALVESTAAGILTAEDELECRLSQAGEGEGFGHAVVHGALTCAHFSALFQQFLHLRNECESRPGM